MPQISFCSSCIPEEVGRPREGENMGVFRKDIVTLSSVSAFHSGLDLNT